MRHGRSRIGVAAFAVNSLLAITLAGSYLPVQLVRATTIVNANVCDQTPGVLSIDSPANGSKVGTAAAVISGQVSRLSQIRTYINGTYHTTVPLDTGSTSFSYTTNLSAGDNIVKLVGIDPCNANGPEDEITLTYDPAVPINPVTHAVEQTKAGAVAAADYMNNQVAEAAQTKPAAGLSGALYTVMQALDLAPVGAPTDEINHMTKRFAGVATGAVLIVAAQPILAAYHVVRYQLMQWNIHAFPFLVRHHALLVLRVLGAGLFIGAFFI